MKLPKHAFFSGRIVPYSKARVGVLTHTLNYGTGVFGGIRGYWNEEEQQLFVFRASDHLRRFLQSASLLSMIVPFSEDALIHSLIDLLRAENYRHDCYIRPLAYFADEVIGSHLAAPKPDVSIVAVPFPPACRGQEGLHLTVSSWRRVEDNMIPARGKIAGAYVNSFLAKTDCIRAGFDDALLLNTDGHVAEATVANFFLLRNGIVSTPPVTDNILEGITRRTVTMMLREELGIKVQERPIDRSEVYLADEAFVCGTAVEVAAVTRIDHRSIGKGEVGPITASLIDLYHRMVRGHIKKYSDFCTPVYQLTDPGCR
jgi:branched-chain amino acid aminotransferase